MRCTANQHPHKRNHLSRFVRRVAGYAPVLGLVARPDRKMGISVFMRVRNEADWILPSILSLQDFADEIIVVDNGSEDGTVEQIRQVQKKITIPVRLFEEPELDIHDLSNFALARTTFHWTVRWDGDFVAHTTGENNISGLRERLLSLDSRRYYLIYLRLINLCGDLCHQDSREMVHIEEYIHSYSDQARYIHPGRFEALQTPKYYRALFWYEPYAFHVNVKPARRMLMRHFWEDWMELKDYQRHPRLEDYVEAHLPDVFGTSSWDEAQQACILKASDNYIRYSQDTFGPHPELLRPHLKKPKYQLLYDNGGITGRLENVS